MKRLERWYGIAALLPFVVIFVWLGLAGVRFGDHWDEYRIVDSVRDSIKSGILLPGWYNYPSLTYAIAMSTAIAQVPTLHGVHGIAAAAAQLAEIVESPDFSFKLRSVFVILTASIAVFATSAAQRLGLGRLGAAVAGAVVLSSFQVLYHARWIAPDCLAALAAAATLAASLRALRDERDSSLLIAAALAGLAAAAKYPAGLVLLLPIAAAWRRGARGTSVARVLAAFAAAYLVVTPGTLIAPVAFVHDLRFEMAHYGRLGHGMYTVHPGWQHLVGILDFLTFRLASPSSALSALVFAAAVGGAVASWRRSPREAFMLTVVPVIYVPYMASQHVMIVRNLLLLVPFIAVLAAIAVDWLAERLSRRLPRDAFALGALLLLASNWPFLIRSTRSLGHTDPATWSQSVVVYVEAHPDRRFTVSPKVAELLAATPGASQAHLYPAGAADAYIFMFGEHQEVFSSLTPEFGYRTLANRRGNYVVVAGPDDIDLDYYPNWSGLSRVVAVDARIARVLAGGTAGPR
jgi:4-amino-4-deoxy-L-arabinose transferase-like glycosyltransferase